MAAYKGIKKYKIHETPIAVVDFETTGLTPGLDRVVEISVYKLEPGKSPYLTFDTLVNPLRPMTATEIHGITDKDVKKAPTFSDIVGDFIDSLSGCVFASYNVYFDIKFLDYELKQTGISHLPPHFCLMYMRPMLNLGKRCNLKTACREHSIDYNAAHIASVDAEASAKLMEYYLDVLSNSNILTFEQLSRLKSYKYLNSFVNNPLPEPSQLNLQKSERLLSRSGCQPFITIDPQRQAINEYWDTLKTVLSDLEISKDEQTEMIEIRTKHRIPKEKVTMLHARAFASVIARFIEDKWLDDKEVSKLRKLYTCLSKLGWAPGE